MKTTKTNKQNDGQDGQGTSVDTLRSIQCTN